VHFVNLNIYAGESADAEGSLSFLIDDLAQYVGDSYRPVVLMQHYGMDGFGRTWWTAAEQQAFAMAIEDYNILGVLHGHLHTTDHYSWNGIDFFNGSSAKDGNFLVLRIANGELDVAARIDDRWGYTFSKAIVVPEASSLILALLGGGSFLLLRRRKRVSA
jgi:cytolysin (calcineurin-like family phosphatase)